MLSSASSDLGKEKFNDTYYYLKHQILYGFSLGIVGLFITIKFYYKNLEKFAPFLLLVSIIALILVFSPLGISYSKGASRWLTLGPISIQPAELLKISFILYLAAWLSNLRANRQASFYKGFLPLLAISGLVAFLILSQPATTTFVIIMFSAMTVYFISGAKLHHILGIALIGIVAISLVIVSSGYRYNRIKAYFNNESNLETIGYQLNQSKMAIGSGGLFGVGFGKSTIKNKYLPESIGDSIFSVIANEFGFVGVSTLISVFLVLIIRGFYIAKKSRDQFAKFTVIGFISIIAIQAFVHMASNSGLLPLTGIPLPFISFGGTSLAAFLTMTGIIANISKYT